MKTINLNKKYFPITIVLLVILLATAVLANRRLNAAPTNAASVTAVQDSFTDINFPATNFDGGLLTAANSSSVPETPDVITKYIYLEFDLSGVAFPINSAALSLSTLTCGGLVTSDDVDVVVYGLGNSANWSAANLTWDNQPAPSTAALISLDGGAVAAGAAQTHTWTDYNKGAFSAWLETQRAANNGSATLVLAVDNAGNPGLADVFFEDSEGSGATYGCADAGAGPTLDVSENVTYFVYLPAIMRQ